MAKSICNQTCVLVRTSVNSAVKGAKIANRVVKTGLKVTDKVTKAMEANADAFVELVDNSMTSALERANNAVVPEFVRRGGRDAVKTWASLPEKSRKLLKKEWKNVRNAQTEGALNALRRLM